MKATKLILFFILVTKSLFSQILWSYHYGSNDEDNFRAITTDLSNNIYASGAFKGSYLKFNLDSISCIGYNDIYLAKFDQTGNELWAKRFGGNNTSVNSEGTPGHYYDKYSNALLISGSFSPLIQLGTNIFNSVNGKCFFTKLDTAGNVIWAKQLNFFFRGVTSDSLGNIYTWGNIANADSIDSIQLQPGVFMAKFDSTGAVQWAKKMFNVILPFGQMKVTPYGIKVNNTNIYLVAETIGDTITIDTTNYYPPYSNSGALMKFTNDGNLVWMKTFGPNGKAIDLGIDAWGNCYVPSSTQGKLYIGNDSVSSQGAGIYDGVFFKYDSSGQLQWIRQLFATAGAVFGRVTCNDDGNCYSLSSVLGGSASFGSFNINSAGTFNTPDNYVARYNYSGDCIGVQQIGITDNGSFEHIDQDNSNNLVAIGDYQNSITLGGTTYGSYGSTDIAIAKLAAITGIGGEGKAAHNQLLIYANPTAGKCNITVPDEFKYDKNLTLSIYANDGKLIQQKKLEMSSDKIKLNLEAEAKGVYNVTLSNGLKSYSGKIVFE